MDRESQTYKCEACGYETERSYRVPSDAYGLGEEVDIQAENAATENVILKNPCPVCRSGEMLLSCWLDDPLCNKMTTQDYINLLEQGADAWNSWRKQHRACSPLLYDVDLRRFKHLNDCDLTFSSFVNCDMRDLDLRRALDFSVFKHASPENLIRLESCNLQRVNMSGVYIAQPNFNNSNFRSADLSHSKILRPTLDGCCLVDANLQFADMSVLSAKKADFTGCHIHGHKLRSIARHDFDAEGGIGLQSAIAKYLYDGENADLRVPIHGEFSSAEFAIYLSPPTSIDSIMERNTCYVCDQTIDQGWLYCPYCSNRLSRSTFGAIQHVCPILGMEFVYVSGTELRMGDLWGTGELNERPSRMVSVPSFQISKFPVTMGHWRTVCDRLGMREIRETEINEPVVGVDISRVQSFIYELNKMTKNAFHYRLPSEAEWECAARSEGYYEQFPGIAGNGENLADYAWYKANSNGKPHPVGTRKPNELGIHDMAGNVYEWCLDANQDTYHDNLSANSPWLTEGGKARHVLRGGSFSSPAHECRTSSRKVGEDFQDSMPTGFRLVVDIWQRYY